MLKATATILNATPAFELDTTQFEQHQINTLMDTLLSGAKAFYAQPGAEEYFQEWKKRNQKNT